MTGTKVPGWDGSSPIHAAHKFPYFSGAQGETLRLIEDMGYTCGIGAAIVGLGLYSYSVRELSASLFLFFAAFFFLGPALAVMFTIRSASQQLVIRGAPASRNAIAFSRRLMAAHARPSAGNEYRSSEQRTCS